MELGTNQTEFLGVALITTASMTALIRDFFKYAPRRRDISLEPAGLLSPTSPASPITPEPERALSRVPAPASPARRERISEQDLLAMVRRAQKSSAPGRPGNVKKDWNSILVGSRQLPTGLRTEAELQSLLQEGRRISGLVVCISASEASGPVTLTLAVLCAFWLMPCSSTAWNTGFFAR